MDILFNIIGFILTLGILVTVHEYGHFWAARKMGVKVLRFSVGFGKPLKTWYDKQGTEFAIAAIPLGGYVKMVDERESAVKDEDLSGAFNRKPVGARIFIAAAGPVANFLFAIFAYWILYMVGVNGLIPKLGPVEQGTPAFEAGLRHEQVISHIDGKEVSTWKDTTWALFDRIGETGSLVVATKDGNKVEIPIQEWLKNQDEPRPLSALGIQPYYPEFPSIVGLVQESSAASAAGLKVGDEILTYEGKQLEDWRELVEAVKASPNSPLNLEIMRNGGVQTITVIPQGRKLDDGREVGYLGVAPQGVNFPPELISNIQLNPISALVRGAADTWNMTVRIVDSLVKMVEGLLSVKNLSGPITIAKVAGSSAQGGFEAFVAFLAYVSIMLGVVNLLPIPVLDGGHILFYSIEAIKGSPVSEKVQMLGIQVGMALLFCVMAIAFYNDLSRL